MHAIAAPFLLLLSGRTLSFPHFHIPFTRFSTLPIMTPTWPRWKRTGTNQLTVLTVGREKNQVHLSMYRTFLGLELFIVEDRD